MSKTIIFYCFFAVVLVLSLPMNSVVSKPSIRVNEPIRTTPLFSTRLHRLNQIKTSTMDRSYLGKESIFSIDFFGNSLTLHHWITKGRLFSMKYPHLYMPLINAFLEKPDINNILKDNDISEDSVRYFLNNIMKNDALYDKFLQDSLVQISNSNQFPSNPPEPQGFSGQMGCLLAFFIILPILVMIGTMIATFTIITCLNLGGCFEKIMKGIFEGFSQSLNPGF